MEEINKFFKSDITFEKNKKIIINGGLTEKMFEQIQTYTPFKEHVKSRSIPIIHMGGGLPTMHSGSYEIKYTYEFDFDEVLGFVTIPEEDLFKKNHIYHADYVIYTNNYSILKFNTKKIRDINNIKLTDKFMDVETNIGFYDILQEDYELTNEDYPLQEYPDDNWDDEIYAYHPSKIKTVEEILTRKSIDKLLLIKKYYESFFDRLRFHKLYIR